MKTEEKNWDKLSSITGGTLSSCECLFPPKAPATVSKICHSSSAIISDDVQTGVLRFKHRTTRMMRTTLVSSSALWPYLTVYLCVPFISVHPAVLLLPQAPRWLREGVSGLIQLTSAHCLLSIVTKDKSRDVLTPRALVRLCCQPCREPDVRIFFERCVHCAVFFLRRSCFLHTKFTLVPWEAVRSCSCATCCTQRLQNTDRGPTAEIDVPSLKPACRL